MKFYCERVQYDSDNQLCEVVLDFASEKDINIFSMEMFGTRPKMLQSIIILKNVKYILYKGFKSGNWYEIPFSIFFGDFQVQTDVQESSRILSQLEYTSNSSINAQELKINMDKTYIRLGIASDKFNFQEELLDFVSMKTEPQLIVRNVGCGNWNEIKNDDKAIIYDLGADIKFSDSKMRNIIKQSSVGNEYIGIISHWDLDHYRAILDMEEKELLNMKGIVIPTLTANTFQFQKTIDRITTLNIPIIKVNPSVRVIKRRVTLKKVHKFGKIDIYRSCDGANINQSGIVLVVRGESKNAVLTGDHHYSQLRDSVFQDIDLNKQLVFVVPHHGGNAGSFDASYKKVFPKKIEGALSTKVGRYRNLPRSEIHNFFVGVNKFHCTDCDQKDYITFL